MATSSGKKCFKKLISNKNHKSKVQNVTHVVPVGHITNGSVTGEARPLKKDELKKFRKQYGAGSIEYKQALQNGGQNQLASSNKNKNTILEGAVMKQYHTRACTVKYDTTGVKYFLKGARCSYQNRTL